MTEPKVRVTFIGGPLNGKTISSDAAKITVSMYSGHPDFNNPTTERAYLRLVHGIYHRGADGDYTWSGEWNETWPSLTPKQTIQEDK